MSVAGSLPRSGSAIVKAGFARARNYSFNSLAWRKGGDGGKGSAMKNYKLFDYLAYLVCLNSYTRLGHQQHQQHQQRQARNSAKPGDQEAKNAKPPGLAAGRVLVIRSSSSA